MSQSSPRWLRSPRVARDVAGRAADALRCAAFWTAVAAPLAYVPLFARGNGEVPPRALAAVLAVHAAALAVGYRHDPEGKE